MKFYSTLAILIFIVSLSFAQVPQYVPTQNLEAWYSFNGNTNDLSGNANHLTNNGATITTDRHGNSIRAYIFDGVNDNMINTVPSFIFGETSSFTISFWTYTNANPGGYAYWHGLTLGQGGTGKFIHCAYAGVNNGFKWGTNSQANSWIWADGTYSLGQWEHWACVYDNKTMILYKDGNQVDTTTYTYSGAIAQVIPFYLGSNSNNADCFSGKIDDIGIWSRALTVSEINNLNHPCVTVYGGTENVTSCDYYTSQSGKTYTSSGSFQDSLLTTYDCDSIITLNLTLNSSSASTETITECFEFTSPSGSYTWTTTGTYYDTITNTTGCDSVITFNLTINTVNTPIAISGITISAITNGANYQWLNCDNYYAVIPGATGQTYTPTVDGNYAVEITENGCVDTSFCQMVTGTGIEEANISNAFSIYPNPNDGSFTLKSNYINNNSILELHSIDGRLLLSKYLTFDITNSTTISFPELNNGIYFIYIKSEDKLYTSKLIIQK